jgi:hypothetical protein
MAKGDASRDHVEASSAVIPAEVTRASPASARAGIQYTPPQPMEDGPEAAVQMGDTGVY